MPRTVLAPIMAVFFALPLGAPSSAGPVETPGPGRGSVRPAAVAGTFYPADPEELKRQLEGFLLRVPEVEVQGQVVAVIAPHAGYVYSGQVAAHTHSFLRDMVFDTAVIIGHDSHARGIVAILSPADHYETPLGRLPVYRDMVAALTASHRGIITHKGAHAREHTVEMQLPFLQVLGKECAVVPVLFGDPTAENCRIFAKAIAEASGDKKVLVIASTDLAHYPAYDQAKTLDAKSLALLSALDIDAFIAGLKKLETDGGIPGVQTAMCARGGVGTALAFAKARGADRVQILHYANSGDVPAGDKNRVVGYAAALILRSTPDQ